MSKKNLLITTIGENNHMSSWMDGDRTYDIAVVVYDEHRPMDIINNCVKWDTFKTFKFEGIRKLINKYPSLSEYDYYWMPDEDIWATTEMINDIFDKTEKYDLWCSQPSVLESEDSFPSWGELKHRDISIDLIYTNFIEIMCPCFSRRAMNSCFHLFDKSKSGWGLDVVWSRMGSDKRMAIINSIAIKHTRPVRGGNLYESLHKAGIYPSRERKSLMKEYGIPMIDIKTVPQWR